MLPAPVAVLVAAAIGTTVYLLNGVDVRHKLQRDRRSDNPLRRAHAVDTAAVGQVAGVGHAVASWFAVFLTLLVPTPPTAFLVGIVAFLALGVPVSRWERRRLQSITG